MKDKGTGAENLIWLASRQSGRANPSLLAADDILAALTGRIAELEARVFKILADLGPELPPVDSKRGGALSAPEPDAELTRASEERRMLANEMRLLREAIQEARSQPSAGLGANAVEARVAPDPRAAIADEMRVLLAELFADFRSRAVAPSPPVEHVPAKGETIVEVVAAALTPTVDEVLEDLQAAAPLVDSEAVSPIETVQSIVEHVDELVRPALPLVEAVGTAGAPTEASESIVERVDELVRPTTNPLIDNSVADLQEPEPAANADVVPVDAAPAQPAAGFVEDYEEFFRTESPLPTDTVEFQVAPPEPAASIVEEHVFGAADPVAPIIDELVEELRLPEAPPMETIELSAAPAEPIHEFIEELRGPEVPAPAEPIQPILDEYVEPLPRTEFTEPIVDPTMAPPAPPSVPDPRLAALWDAAPFPTEAESAPLAQPEPVSFITEDFIAETRPLEIPEAPPETTQEFAQEQAIEFAPPQEFPLPPQEFPLPPQEFPPDPPVIVEPEPEAWTAEPLISEPEQARSFSSMFPELTAADERGLHQIQVVISPIHSFARLLETERRIRALSTVNALHLRDFRNGVATLTVAVSEAISPAEFGAVIQMLESLHLRLEGSTQSTVELHAQDEPPTS